MCVGVWVGMSVRGGCEGGWVCKCGVAGGWQDRVLEESVGKGPKCCLSRANWAQLPAALR